ncbi:hypothetical protein G7Z17_g10467 [Cylindrodendrum hubeiense]|uniref:Uncharacterized protein n=1 Tax=Cylindrodendrum hubeiense TaxID=595255 RepID=A0A9P5GXM5_9HYPO|nr:hypothetical protein G7Z17_g10467 [Cylindrodendrum hubeiense]
MLLTYKFDACMIGHCTDPPWSVGHWREADPFPRHQARLCPSDPPSTADTPYNLAILCQSFVVNAVLGPQAEKSKRKYPWREGCGRDNPPGAVGHCRLHRGASLLDKATAGHRLTGMPYCNLAPACLLPPTHIAFDSFQARATQCLLNHVLTSSVATSRHVAMARTRAAEQPNDDHATRRNPTRRASRTEESHPPRASTRSHPRIHYKDDSSSDGDDVSDSSLPSADDATESDLDSDVPSASDTRFGSRPRRHTRRPATKPLTESHGSRRSARQAAISHPQTIETAPESISQSKPARRQPSRKRPNDSNKTPNVTKRRRMIHQQPEIPLPQGIIPDWRDPQMPYGAWTDIFYYAATTGGHDTLDVNWLINAATTCKAFSEPALTAIYRCPPITTPGKAKRLAALLERSPSETRFNYHAKIESVYIDIQVVPQSVLSKIVFPLPRLRELVFFTQYDQPPYRELGRTVRWHYLEDIFRALMPSTAQSEPTNEKPFHTALRSWEWSGRLLGGHVPTIQDITRVHRDPSFAHLTKLSFTNFQVPSLDKPRPKPGDEERELELFNEDCAVIDSIADAISQLQSLQHLVFESSTVMNHRLLSLLPKELTHFSLINCWEVKSDDLEMFLHAHGRNIRTLTLSHNQSLDMAFLPNLANACPHLEELRMNLSYFRLHETLSLVNNDSDPMYEVALLPHQIPKWPASLRVVDFEHIRHWSVETAEMFLHSLIDNAGNLPNLRHLAIKTMLNIPWKARADMRHQWRKKLDKVFLRRYEPPRTHTSLRQPPIDEVAPPPQEKQKKKRLSDPPSRRSTRLAVHASDSESRNSSNSKGRRSLGRPTYQDPETDEDEFESSDDDGDDSPAPGDTGPQGQDEGASAPAKPVIQGLCTTVSIVFDNQKPTELQYGMEDFMDEDRTESDGDWDGDQDDDEAAYAW